MHENENKQVESIEEQIEKLGQFKAKCDETINNYGTLIAKKVARAYSGDPNSQIDKNAPRDILNILLRIRAIKKREWMFSRNLYLIAQKERVEIDESYVCDEEWVDPPEVKIEDIESIIEESVAKAAFEGDEAVETVFNLAMESIRNLY